MLISVDEAKKIISNEKIILQKENVQLDQALNRIIADPIYTDRNYPPFNRSGVDGFAIDHREYITGKEFEIAGELHAGFNFDKTARPGTAIKIMTGAAVPAGFNCVIKVEDSIYDTSKVSFKIENVQEYLNIAREGEDLKKSEVAIPANTKCGMVHTGILAGVGLTQVPVYKNPTVAIISTGTELKAPGQPVEPWEIRDTNSFVIDAYLKRFGIKAEIKLRVKDEKDELTASVSKASNCDLIFITGGVSMGDADFVPEVLKSMGGVCLFHKVAIRPGKPFYFGKLGSSIVFALPGNPLSVQVGLKVFVEYYLNLCFSQSPENYFYFPYSRERKKKIKLDEYFPCILNRNNLKLESVKINGSGDYFSSVHSHGIALHEKDRTDLQEGDFLKFIFW